MPRYTPPDPAMDLANLRKNGVRSIAVQCIDCGRSGIVNVDTYPGHLPVKSFEGRMVCKCGSDCSMLDQSLRCDPAHIAHERYSHSMCYDLRVNKAGLGV